MTSDKLIVLNLIAKGCQLILVIAISSSGSIALEHYGCKFLMVSSSDFLLVP